MNDASRCTVEANEIWDCGTGAHIWRWCKQEGLNEDNRIAGNSFTGITGNAIQLGTGTAKNTVTGNDIDGSGRNGISVSGKAQVLKDNRIRGSKLKDIVINEPGAVVE